MKMKEDPIGNKNLKAAYNIQIGTENQFILGYSAHQKPGDSTLLKPHLEHVQKITGKLPENIIADAAYGSEENYDFIEKHNIENYLNI